ncbi:N-acetyltransferase [Vibrio parahaemolyticus]|uniref:N-acetyltransferase n=1 Tax=Vibrio TaxID=662 RepID=UPI001123A1A2|nr:MULTISPECIES: N-acetyltransferase [Vibrio harveyi group]EID4391986.1 N-acetyltransferase [Vibrio vulnificus]MDF6016850.1 N-acetyltransferase [Vibrio harveyi]NVC74146.1 N-acetyltransferase [Vibrio vulnificus]QLE36220.1 N-acetyltransferase [Vibrio parahaemolyticus]TOQ93798.1 N-acetyltransferase [Vibrio parahaemolyticus]
MKTGEFKMWQLLEKPSIKKQFKRWLKLQEEDPFIWKDCDFESNGIQLLFRNYTNDINEPCMTIASVYLSKDLQNKGVLKSLLNYVSKKSPWDIIAFEDVDNPILRDFCFKYGFKPISARYSTSFFIEKSQLINFHVDKFNY